MQKNTTSKHAGKAHSGHTSSEELVRLHESFFKGASTTYADDGFVGFPPGFEFKKVTIWEDVPSIYSTSTHTGVRHA
jgi:hypothetical protein